MSSEKPKGHKNQEEELKNEKDKVSENEVSSEKEAQNHSLSKQCTKENYDALWDKYTRLCAEFTNTRKRWDREKAEIIKFSNSSLLRDLLIVLDETEQALRMTKEHSNIEQIIKGLEMTYNNFVNVLKKRGLKAIESVGKPFDPHLHEIVASKEVDEDIDKPIVLEEIQKGYMLEDKVLRPSQVIVGIQRQKTEGRGQETEEEGQKPENKNNDENNKI